MGALGPGWRHGWARPPAETLLRLIPALPDPQPEAVAAVGVDDFAIRRGHTYDTVLVDMASRRPVELLPDRDADSFAAWLRAHPTVEIVCRDRSGAYAEAARTAAPAAIQVADRWHLWHNLCAYVHKAVARRRSQLAEAIHPETGGDDNPGETTAPSPENIAHTRAEATALATRTRARYEVVQQHRAEGMAIKAIARTMGLDRKTVRRFAYFDMWASQRLRHHLQRTRLARK